MVSTKKAGASAYLRRAEIDKCIKNVFVLYDIVMMDLYTIMSIATNKAVRITVTILVQTVTSSIDTLRSI